MDKPKVSIVCITYNHEKYIAQAIDSFLLQKCNYPIEIIVADDASTDSTQSIIKMYAQKYPKMIVPILRRKNAGVGENLKCALMNAQGDYIALCEGDDYWIKPDKLQLQSNFLDKRDEYELCFHSTKVIYEDGGASPYMMPGSKKGFTLRKLISTNFMHTSSVMYRRSNYSKLPTDILPVDWYLNLQHAKLGKIGFINKTMSIYRRNKNSVWFPGVGKTDDFWIKRGVGHAVMFEAVHKLFEHTKYVGDIEIVQNEWIQFLVDLDNKHNQGIIVKLCTKTPRAVERYTKQKNKEFLQLKSEVSEAHRQLALIKQSFVWRLRNKCAKVVGRQKI